MAASIAEALVYLALYTVCPLALFPVGLLAVAAEFVFDPVKGVVLTLLAGNVSSSIAYLVGRYFGKGLPGPERSAGTSEPPGPAGPADQSWTAAVAPCAGLPVAAATGRRKSLVRETQELRKAGRVASTVQPLKGVGP